MNLTEAARELGVSLNTLYARIDDGTLKPLPINPALKARRYRFNRAYIEAFKAGQQPPAPPSDAQGSEEAKGG